MRSLILVLPFVALTFLSWGTYGPLLQEGKHAMDNSSLRPFVGVGVAYFIIAVLVPLWLLSQSKEKGSWSFSGTILSILAGSVGALGALGVILALTAGGKPVFVMPLVFGFAPVVNTLVTAWISKTYRQINPIFISGMIAVALGACGVMIFKPTAGPVAVNHSSNAIKDKSDATNKSEAAKDVKVESEKKPEADGKTESGATKPAESAKAETEPKTAAASATNTSNSSINLNVIGAIAMAALCWGAYGPVLHIGQMKMGGSRLRPFCCVGIAYFIIAVAVPLLILNAWNEPGRWTAPGMMWSIAAGTAGALGALGIILAFNFGGKPIYVMPLVFGFAPVVNTFTTMIVAGTVDAVGIPFMISLAVSIVGAVTVLIFAPKAKPQGAPVGR